MNLKIYRKTKYADSTIFRAFCHVPLSEGMTGLEANHERRKGPHILAQGKRVLGPTAAAATSALQRMKTIQRA